jgi:hypothetical protein
MGFFWEKDGRFWGKDLSGEKKVLFWGKYLPGEKSSILGKEDPILVKDIW